MFTCYFIFMCTYSVTLTYQELQCLIMGGFNGTLAAFTSAAKSHVKHGASLSDIKGWWENWIC